MAEFNKIGIKVPRVGWVYATSANSAPLEILVKDINKVPSKAERFAKAMVDAGFSITGGTMETLGDEDFAFVVAAQ